LLIYLWLLIAVFKRFRLMLKRCGQGV